MQRHDGNGITFDGTIADCDVCAVGKGQQLARSKKAQHAGITRPFRLCYGDLMGPFTPEAYGVSNTSSRLQTRSPSGPPSTCWRTRAAHSTPSACSSHQLLSLAVAESFAGVQIKERNARAKRSSSIAWKQASPRSLRPPTRLSKMACPGALAGLSAIWFAAFSSTVDSRPSCRGSSCSLRLTAATVCHTPGLTWRRRSSGYTARRPICRISSSSALEHSSTSRMTRSWNPSPGRNAVWLQRGRSALLSGLEPENSQGGGEQERDVHRDSAASYSATYTTLSALGVAAS